MSSTPGPAPDEDADEEPTMALDELFEVLDAQAGSLHCAIRAAEEVAEPGEQLPRDHLESVRTEVVELQAAVEDLLTEHCPAATPWEYAGEHVPDANLEAFAGRT